MRPRSRTKIRVSCPDPGEPVDRLARATRHRLVAIHVHGALDALERGEQSIAAEWLEQIVDRLELERGDGKFVVRRREDDRRLVRDRAQNVEPIQLGHLDVEKDEIGLDLIDHADGRASVGGLADELDPVDGGQQVAQLPAGDRFVLDDDGSCLHTGANVACVPVVSTVACAGSVTRTTNPSPGAVVTSNRQCSG